MKIILVIFLFISFSSIANSVTRNSDLRFTSVNGQIEVYSKRHPHDKFKASLNGKIISVLTSGKVLEKFSLEGLKLCVKPDGSFEPWSFHVNNDGSYGLIGENVRILSGNIEIDSSSLCGFIEVSGHVRIRDSYIEGGATSEKKLQLLGELQQITVPLDLNFVRSNSQVTGKIIGHVSMSRVEIGKNIYIDSCTLFQKSADECLELNSPNFHSLIIDDSKIDGPSNQFFGSVYMKYSQLNGTSLIKGKNQSHRVYFDNVTISLLSPFTKIVNNFVGKNISVTGSLQIENLLEVESVFENVSIQGSQLFSGPQLGTNVNFSGNGKYICTGVCHYQTEIEGPRITMIANDFTGQYGLFGTSSNNNKILAENGKVIFGKLQSLGGNNIFSGFVTIEGGSTIGSNVNINGSFPGIRVSGVSSISGPNTQLSGYFLVDDSNIRASTVLDLVDSWTFQSSAIRNSDIENSAIFGSMISNGGNIYGFNSSSGLVICGPSIPPDTNNCDIYYPE